MPVRLANNASSQLATSIVAGSTSIVVTNGDGSMFPSLAPDDFFPLTIVAEDGFEIVRATARSGDVITIQRGLENTLPRDFAAGARVELRLTAQTFLDLIADKLDAAGGVITGNLGILGILSVEGGILLGGNAVWHEGNFDPDSKLGSSGDQTLMGETLTILADQPRTVYQGTAGALCAGIDDDGDFVISTGADFSDPLLRIDADGHLWTKAIGRDIQAEINAVASAAATAAASAVETSILAAIAAAGYVEDVRLGARLNQTPVAISPGPGHLLQAWAGTDGYGIGSWRPVQVKRGDVWVTITEI